MFSIRAYTVGMRLKITHDTTEYHIDIITEFNCIECSDTGYVTVGIYADEYKEAKCPHCTGHEVDMTGPVLGDNER